MTNPSVAVITPYYGESLEILEQCHRSVREQTYPCLHILVADGQPYTVLESWQAHHLVLPWSHHDIGSTPRLIGSYHAIGLGVEAVAFLDADNWYEATHIAELMDCHQRTGAAFLSSGRMLCQPDGTPLGACPNTDPDNFIDTSCMLFTEKAFHLLHHWVLMPPYAHLIGDRVMLHHIRSSGLPRHHHPVTTVNYRCGKEGIYHQLGLAVPKGVAPKPNYEESIRKWHADGNPPLDLR